MRPAGVQATFATEGDDEGVLGITGERTGRNVSRRAGPLPGSLTATATACHTAPMRFFNTEGPVRPDKHYCVPPLARLDLDRILTCIRREKYFVLHAPRQTGKTSALLARRWLRSAGATRLG